MAKPRQGNGNPQPALLNSCACGGSAPFPGQSSSAPPLHLPSPAAQTGRWAPRHCQSGCGCRWPTSTSTGGRCRGRWLGGRARVDSFCRASTRKQRPALGRTGSGRKLLLKLQPGRQLGGGGPRLDGRSPALTLSRSLPESAEMNHLSGHANISRARRWSSRNLCECVQRVPLVPALGLRAHRFPLWLLVLSLLGCTILG